MRPASHALLYRKGYARRPSDVVIAAPQYIREGFQRLKSMRVSNPFKTDEGTLILGRQGVRDATADNLQIVVQATQFALFTFAFALLVTLIAMFLPTPQQSLMQWMGTLGFVCAWSGLSAGIWQRREDWLMGSLWKTVKWWLTIFAPVAIFNLFLSPPAS